MAIQFGNTQDNNKKLENMQFSPPNVGVINPAPVSGAPLKKYLSGMKETQSQSQDSYVPQEQVGAMNLGTEAPQMIRQASSGIKNFLIASAALVIGGTMILSKKAQDGAKKLIDKIFNNNELILSTKKKLDEFATALFEKIKTSDNPIITKADIKPIKIRFSEKTTENQVEIKEIMAKVSEIAKEYSHCNKGVPEIFIKLQEGTAKERAVIEEHISAGTLSALEDTVLSKIESIEVNFLKQEHKRNITNDIDYKVHSRNIKINSDGEYTLSGMWNGLKNWFNG